MDNEPGKAAGSVSVRDLLEEIREGQRETNKQQAEMLVHFAELNGTVAKLQERSTSHSGKLDDQAGVLSDHATRLAVVERVTEIRDEHLSADVRDARSGSWEARVVAGDVRTEAIGWFRQAAVTAVMVLALLLLAGGGLALLVFG